jgi:hypothetical protein
LLANRADTVLPWPVVVPGLEDRGLLAAVVIPPLLEGGVPAPAMAPVRVDRTLLQVMPREHLLMAAQASLLFMSTHDMKTYALVHDGVVVELVFTDRDIDGLFHPDMIWAEVKGDSSIVTCGCIANYDGVDWKFSPPSKVLVSEVKSKSFLRSVFS